MNTLPSTELIDRLAAEFVERYRRGERPPVSEYAARCPERAEEIRDLFPALVVLENFKPAPPAAGTDQAHCATEVSVLGKLGDYRIIREIGRGGMGIVYEAVQESLGRRVALKVLPKQLVGDQSRQARFEREARSAARLHHTNIVPVYGVGEECGLHYYAMQYIHGQGLDEVLRELKRLKGPSHPAPETKEDSEAPASDEKRKEEVGFAVTQALLTGRFETPTSEPATIEIPSAAPPADVDPPTSENRKTSDTTKGRLSDTVRLSDSFAFAGLQPTKPGSGRESYWQGVARIGIQVGEALHYAHEQGVLHRDVKPSNLLLDSTGSVWVTDFGLAKTEDERALTHTGDVVGTLRYMAPEMFSGHADRRSDGYSLGLTLYELLALRPAFNERDRGRLIRMVLNESPPKLRTLDPHIPRDLETIVHKAIDREPSHRYLTGRDLADDLQRYLRDEPIHARRVSIATRFSRWCKRNPAVASLTSAIAILLLAAAISSSIAAVYLNRARIRANDATRQASNAAIQERKLRKEADKQRAEAVTQRDRANASDARARRAVDSYLSKVTDEELLSVPGLQPLREELLADALKFYSEFTQEQSNDPQLQIELASAQFRLGIVHRELGNTVPFQAANKEAIRMLESLRDRKLGGVDVLSLLADAYFYAGRYDDTVKLCQEILKAKPDAVSARSTLAETYNELAIKEKDQKNDVAATLKYHQQAFEIREKLANEFPENAAYNAELASTINNIGVLLGNQNKPQEQLAMFQLAVTYNEKACRLAPHSILWGRWQATGYGNIGSVQLRLGQPQETLQAYQKKASIWQRLVAQNPAVGYLRSDYYQALVQLAEQQKQMRLPDEANRTTRDAKEVLASLQRRSTSADLFELATVYASLAAPPDPKLEARADTPEAADERQRNADRAMDTLQQAVDAGWADPAALKNYKVLDVLRERPQFQKLAKVVQSVSEAASLLNGNATTDQAKLANQQKALELLNKVGAEVPEQVGHQRLLASTYHSIGVIQTGLKQFDEAEKSLQQALQLRNTVRQAQPDKPELEIYWIGTRVAIGNLYSSSARLPEAHRMWQECSRDLLEIARANRDNALLQQRIAEQERLMCDGYGRYGLWPLAGPYVQRAVEFQRVSSYEQDAELAALLLLPENANVADQYLAMLAKTSPGTEERESWAVTHLVRTAALARSNAVPASELVSRARKALAFRKDNPWWAMVLAKALYRAGEIEEADELVRGLGELGSHAFANPQLPYVRAVIASARGDDSDARANFELGESLYRRACRETLAHPAVNSLGLPNENWHEFILVQAQRREAMRLLQGDEPGDDPWQHLVQARGYRLIGEKEKADAELAAAKALAPSDSEVLIAAIELESSWGDARRIAEADWQRAIDLAGENSLLPLIRRGRWHAERGEHEKADADFAKAASMTPGELNKFLEAGWWVAGPYPPELKEFCPPELDPDPSQPVYVIDPAKGLSYQPVAWRYAPTGELGLVDLLPVFESEQMSAYALTYIYSPDARPATLLVGGDDHVRLWVNGRLEYDYDKNRTWNFGLARVPVILRAGRNVILAKVRQYTGNHRLLVRVADTPLDRAFTAAEEWRWEEAAPLMTEGVERSATRDSHPLRMQALLLYVSGDMEGHRRLCDQLRKRWGRSTSPHELMTLVHACSLSPETVEDPKQLLTWAEQAQLPAETEKWRKHYLAMAYYRAGQFDETIDCINRDIGPSDQLTWPLLAMAHFRLGKVDEARTWLRKIEDSLQTHFGEVLAAGKVDSNRAITWSWMAEQLIRLREAKQLIDGQAPQVDQLVQNWKVRLREPLSPNDALTAEFDHAVLIEPSLPWHRLARGRLLADVGRWDDAEADFDAAVKLNAQDHVAAAARAAFLAERGDLPRAADAFSSALQAAHAKDWTNLGRMVEYELSQHGAVLQELLRRDPQNSGLNRVRGEFLARQGRWDEARLSYSTDKPHWLHESCQAALSRLLQDHDGYARACARQPDLLRKYARDPELSGARQVEIRGLKSVAPAEAEELVRLMKQNSSTAPLSRHQRAALGLALYRNGQYEDAIEVLAPALVPKDDWQRDARVWPVLAMACWQLDRDDEARQWLAKSDAWIDLTHRAVDIPMSVGPSNTVMDWWLYAHVLHLEAKSLIDGQAAADDVRQRIAASAKMRADEKLVKASPRNADAAALAEAAWNTALERGGENPQLWIAHGRWNIQRGQTQQASADFGRVATMTKGLNPFLDAGWWVAGPVCADPDYEKVHPVETNPDPVTSLLHADGTTRLTWRYAPTGALGYVDVNPIGSPGVKCAVTYLYSERAREAPLLLGGHGTAKVWVNGTYIGRVDGMNGDAFWPPLNRLTVPLRPGRNSLLIKISASGNRSDFYARFSEGDIDRGVDYAQRGLIAEAGDLLERGLTSSTANSTFPWWFAVSSARIGMDDERYGKYCAAIHQRFGDSTNDNWVAINVRAQTLLATPIFESSKLVERAEYRLSFDPQSRDSLFILGLALYRAGRDAEARQRLLESGPGQDTPTPWPVLALVAHRQNDSAEARRWLTRAMRWYDQNLEGLATGLQPVLGNGQWPEFLALLKEATSVIEGRPLADDPRLHLWRARSWISFDEVEMAQADLAAAAKLAPRDHRVWLAIGQIQAGSDALAPSAAASLDKAVELAAGDPLPWIARGRWHAQHGEQAKADADYAKAASLTPSDLHRFLEAGWWVVGPYPRELNEFCPPELDADPSIPVHIVDPQTGLSDEPVQWANIPSGDFGRLELASYSGARGNVSCYALAHVYAPQETTATLCISGKSDARVWINGELVHHFSASAAAGTWSREPQRVPLVLREGRNTILVKGIANSELTLRLGDHPFDRGMELARYGDWKEAADLVEQGLQRSSEVESHSTPFRCVAIFRLAAGDLDAVRRLYSELSLQHQGTTWGNCKEDLVKIGGMAPGIADDPGALVTLAETLRGHASKYSRAVIPLAFVRAGRWQEAIDFCARDGDVAALTEIAPLLAMAHQQLGNSSEAQAQLARTKITDKEMSGWARRNPEFNVKMSLLTREASRMLSGSQAEVEQQFEAFYRQRRAARARSSRETFDFDTAAFVFSGQSSLFIARGKRLAELGRLSEAEADFNQAVSQSPKDTDVLTQRALFYADYGDPQKAAADFDAALKLIESSKLPRWQAGHIIDLAATCRDSVYAPLAAARTKDGVLLHVRTLSLLRRGQREPLAAACQQLEKLWQEPLAPIHLVRGELQEFERLRAGESGSGYDRTLRLGLAPTDEATTVRLLKAADDLAREAPPDRFRNRWIGLAQLRAGRLVEAKTTLLGCLDGQGSWQFNSVVWPMLAIACHQLGEDEEASRWLHKSEIWLHALARLSPAEIPGAIEGRFYTLHDWLVACLLYREAKSLIDGPEAAAAELAAVASPQHKDAPRMSPDQRVEQHLSRLVAAAGNDPLPWIQRGRWLAERGEHERADADFAQAAALTPQELNKFLALGWWVVGPFGADLAQSYPPEENPDPSLPVPGIDPRSNSSGKTWQTFPTDDRGRVDLTSMPPGSAYALAYIYSPDARTALLRLEGNPLEPDRLRLFVNRKLVVFKSEMSIGTFLNAVRVPIDLRPGRNVILVKALSGTKFALRLGDSPVDRAMLLAERRLWPDAAKLFAEDRQAFQSEPQMGCEFGKLALLSGKSELYHEQCADSYKRFRDSDIYNNSYVANLTSLAPNPVLESQYDDVIRLAFGVTSLPADQFTENRNQMATLTAAWAALQTDRLPEAEQYLARLTAGFVLAHSARAILAEKSGNHAEAVERLKQALANAAPMLKGAVSNPIPNGTTRLLHVRAAERIVTGSTTQIDELLRTAYQQDRATWDKADPLTEAYDHLVLTNKALHRPWPPGLAELHRGRRLVELGRFEQAEADFNTAAKLRPGDVEVLTARGTFHADRHRPDAAVTDFTAAIARAPRGEPATRWFGTGAEQIEDLVAQRDKVFERMVAATPRDRYLWIARAHHFGKDLRYKESLPPLLKVVELDPSDPIGWIHAASVRLALGDEEGYRKMCHEMLTRFAKDNGPRVASRVAKTCLLAPLPAEDQAPLRALVERVEQEGVGSSGVALRWDYFVKGLAEYRAGRFAEAITLLKLGLPRQAASPLNDGPTYLVLAMAQFRLGEADKARESLTAALDLLERTLPRLDRGERYGTGWPDRARLEVLRREAITLIEGPDAAALQPESKPAQAAAPVPK